MLISSLFFCIFWTIVKTENKIKIPETNTNKTIDIIIFSTILFSINIIFLLFTLIQFRYLFSFSDILPLGFTYSEYARRGFLELISVTIINIIILLISLLCKNQEDVIINFLIIKPHGFD